MNLSSFPVRLMGAIALTCAASASHAALSFGTFSGTNTASAFLSTLGTPSKGLDSFNDLTINTALGVASLNRSVTTLAIPGVTTGPIGYRVSTETQLYTAQANGIGGAVLSVELNSDTLTFDQFSSPFSGPVYAFGARFFMDDGTYGVNAAQMTVRATEIGGFTQDFTYRQTVFTSTSGATEPLFFRLGSTVGLQSVQLIGPVPNNFDAGGNPLLFASVDNVVVGAVPLPAAGWLLISGLGGMGFLKRRRS